MNASVSGGYLRDMHTLFDAGTVSGISDRQLLQRFTGERGASAEAAFEALVLRHGPMVMRVCRNALGRNRPIFTMHFRRRFLCSCESASRSDGWTRSGAGSSASRRGWLVAPGGSGSAALGRTPGRAAHRGDC